MQRAIILLVSAILILTVAIVANILSLSPAQDTRECITLKESSESKVNIVFIGDKQNALNFGHALETAQPFDNNTFNFYLVEDNPRCEIYKGIAVLCTSRDIVMKASNCPHDFIAVLTDERPSIRSSAFSNIMSINVNHPESVIIHEFGHAFANFAEEYTPARVPVGAKNCARECTDFSECFQGCSEESRFRSINNGVMRTLNSMSYGEFNVNLIKDRLENPRKSIITGNVVESQCNGYLLVEGLANPESLSIISYSHQPGCPSFGGSGPAEYALISPAGQELSSQEINPSIIYTDAPGHDEIDGEPLYPENVPFYLTLDPSTEGNELVIRDDQGIITSFSLSSQNNIPCRIE